VEQFLDFLLVFLFLRQGDLVVRNAGAAQERNTRNATLAGLNSQLLPLAEASRNSTMSKQPKPLTGISLPTTALGAYN
jgi:hypothetical protein